MSEEKIRTIRFHQSIVRPILLGGCDREMFIVLSALCLFLSFNAGLSKGSYLNFVFGIATYFLGTRVLAKMTKKDYKFREIFARSIRYNYAYPARGEARCRERYSYRRWA